MENKSIDGAFDEIQKQLEKTIAISIYDIERFAGMTYKEFCDEEHAEEGTLRTDIREWRLNQVRRDIEMAQENLKLLTKLREKYGANKPTDDFIRIAQETLDVFTGDRSASAVPEGTAGGDDTGADRSVGGGPRDAAGDGEDRTGAADGGQAAEGHTAESESEDRSDGGDRRDGEGGAEGSKE